MFWAFIFSKPEKIFLNALIAGVLMDFVFQKQKSPTSYVLSLLVKSFKPNLLNLQLHTKIHASSRIKNAIRLKSGQVGNIAFIR